MHRIQMTFCIVLCVLCFQQVWSFDILYVSMTTSPSHHIWDKTLMMALHERGHNITMLTHAIEKDRDNLTFIHLEDVYEKMHAEFDYAELVNYGSIRMVTIFFDWLSSLCKFDLKTKGLQTIIKMVKDGRKFDLVVMDILSAAPVYPLLELMGSPPMVGTSPFGMTPYLTYNFGTDTQSSYIPFYALLYTDNMNFIQRSVNYFFVSFANFMHKYIYVPDITSAIEEVYGKGFTPILEFEKNISILLVNYDPVMQYVQSLPPNIIPVGGLHTKRTKELPKDLQVYLDESKNGAILFSLGTNVRSDKLGEKEKRIILNALARLKENVIWKFESDIKDLPKNVICRKWLPQNDIQAHPNLKLFITHGGGLSTQEAMFHGLPVVGIPFFVDQRENVFRMVKRKFGLQVDYNTITEDKLFNAIREVIDNPIYKKNIMELSRRYRDQPQNPLDRAVFWVEYVGRHRDAQFLGVRSRHLNIFQVLHLDLFALIFIVVFVLYYVVVRGCCSKARTTTKKVKVN